MCQATDFLNKRDFSNKAERRWTVRFADTDS